MSDPIRAVGTRRVKISETAAAPLTTEAVWQSSCKLSYNLLQTNQIAEFKTDLQAGHVPQVVEPAMMTAALELVINMAIAGVRRWDWLPAPSVSDLAEPAAWVTRRLAARRAEQDAADRPRRWDSKVARAFGQSQPGSGGTINPIHLQKPKHSLEELGKRLAFVIAEHTKRRGKFRREDLDHRSPYYISDANGGISNKQIVLLANLIVGRQDKRPYDQNWKIVTDWLRDRQAKEEPTQPEPNQA